MKTVKLYVFFCILHETESNILSNEYHFENTWRQTLCKWFETAAIFSRIYINKSCKHRLSDHHGNVILKTLLRVYLYLLATIWFKLTGYLYIIYILTKPISAISFIYYNKPRIGTNTIISIIWVDGAFVWHSIHSGGICSTYRWINLFNLICKKRECIWVMY